MAISLEDPEMDRLAREVAKLTGEGLTEAIRKALEERLERKYRKRPPLSCSVTRCTDPWRASGVINQELAVRCRIGFLT